MPVLRSATADDWCSIEALLAGADLPVADLSSRKLENFLVAEEASALVGLIGLEAFGSVGLLRSLVVTSTARRSGLGGKLVSALEGVAAVTGVRELWLLTIDAQCFFQRHGYQVVERAGVPECISSTTEFSELCPGTAHLMRKALQ